MCRARRMSRSGKHRAFPDNRARAAHDNVEQQAIAMNIRAFTSLAAASAVLAVAGASVSISSPAHAQQAKAQKPPAMDKVPGKMPVTPFGPRPRAPFLRRSSSTKATGS